MSLTFSNFCSIKAVMLALGMVSFLGFLPTNQVQAANVTFGLSGTVTEVSTALSGVFSVGDAFFLTYNFEDTTVANAGSTSTKATYDALIDLNVTVGGYTGTSTASSEIIVQNDLGAPFVFDRYIVESRVANGLTPNMFGGFTLDRFFLELADSTETVFSDAFLPTSLSLSGFDSTLFFLAFENPNDPQDGYNVRGTVDQISAPVPIPASFTLFGTGLAGLIGWRLRKQKTVYP